MTTRRPLIALLTLSALACSTTNTDGGTPSDGDRGGRWRNVSISDLQLPPEEESGAITMTPIEWTVAVDDPEPGVDTILVIVEYAPLSASDVKDVAGRLIWDDMELELCADPSDPPEQWGKFISIRGDGDDFVHIGDIFQQTGQGSGCENNVALEAAFEDHGIPDDACVSVTTNDDVELEYCAPLVVVE